jgi:hypothetical protein
MGDSSIAQSRTLARAVLMAVSVTIAACGCRQVPGAAEWQGHSFREVSSLAAVPATIQSELGVGRPGLEGVAGVEVFLFSASEDRPKTLRDVVLQLPRS